MSGWVIAIIILAIIGAALVALTIAGDKMQKKQASQREMMKEAAQMVSMLVIDKKMMKIKEAGLPKQVMEQTPKRFRNSKLPIVKAKVGPQTLNLICDDAIFDELPTKCEVKAMVSGIYITEIKSVRGKKKKQVEEPKKKTFGQKLRAKQRQLQEEIALEEKNKDAIEKKEAKDKKSKERAKKITQ
ncbi:MAG: hypothetical protein ACI4F4_08660 [Lachnospiraceae bacterium]